MGKPLSAINKVNKLNNSKILLKALELELTESQIEEKTFKLQNDDPDYGDQISGIIWHHGYDGLFKIVIYCRERKLKCHYKVDYEALDKGEVIFELQ